MKYLSFTILALLSLVAFSSCSKPTHESLMEDDIEVMEDVVTILNSVEDEDSAKAAAQKIEKLAERVKEIKKKKDELGDPSDEVEKELKAKYEERMGKTMNDFIAALSKLGAKPELTKHLDESMKVLNGL